MFQKRLKVNDEKCLLICHGLRTQAFSDMFHVKVNRQSRVCGLKLAMHALELVGQGTAPDFFSFFCADVYALIV